MKRRSFLKALAWIPAAAVLAPLSGLLGKQVNPKRAGRLRTVSATPIEPAYVLKTGYWHDPVGDPIPKEFGNTGNIRFFDGGILGRNEADTIDSEIVRILKRHM